MAVYKSQLAFRSGVGQPNMYFCDTMAERPSSGLLSGADILFCHEDKCWYVALSATQWAGASIAGGVEGGGPHTHPQSDITGLVAALAGKAASSHTHAQADITNLVTDLAGKAAASHTHNASDINAGTIGTARLGSGAPDATTFLRGDQTWAVPAGGAGLGYALTVECMNQATTTDAQTIYWGSKNLAHQTTADIHRIYIPKAGTIKVCYAHFHSGTAGTAENWSLYIRKNNTTDTLVQTVGLSNAHRVFSSTGLSIAVVAGDYIELKEIQPTWATNPANVRRSAVIYVE
jgi:hypothetical protein